MKIFIQHFHKVMNRFEIAQVVIIDVHTNAEIQTSIASIDDFKVPELKWDIMGINSISNF